MTSDVQIELFSIPRQPVRRQMAGALGNVNVRHDHVVLLAIVGLIGVSVVFALGVERGKQLARAERSVLPQAVATVSPPSTKLTPIASMSPAKSSTGNAETLSTPVLQRTPKAAEKTEKTLAQKLKSGFAVQLVSYTQPKFAARELERLKGHGERAFLVTGQSKTTLCIGPFPSRDNASEKLVSLRKQYRDCFIRTL